jgi:carbonic anhydrase
MCESCAGVDRVVSRRSVMLGAGAALAAGALSPRSAFAADKSALNAIGPDAALERLMQGNARCVAHAQQQKDCAARRTGLVSAQRPIAAIVSCSDSRVAPELAFDQGPGDLFVVRVAGNFVSDDGLASLEYAVKFLGVPLLMVLGHSDCGAVAAAVQVVTSRKEFPGHLPKLIESIEPAVIAAHGRHPGDLVAASIEENVKLNVKRMKEDEPILSEALAANAVAAHGGIYDLATGKVSLL